MVMGEQVNVNMKAWESVRDGITVYKRLKAVKRKDIFLLIQCCHNILCGNM